jgi:hypothetical protein
MSDEEYMCFFYFRNLTGSSTLRPIRVVVVGKACRGKGTTGGGADG